MTLNMYVEKMMDRQEGWQTHNTKMFFSILICYNKTIMYSYIDDLWKKDMFLYFLDRIRSRPQDEGGS